MPRKIRTARALLVACGVLGAAGVAHAEITANVGAMSDYVFRGIPQSTGSAMGGVDFESGGFYLGTWGADVGQGAEVDVYLGYGLEFGNGFTLSVGGTGYYYTDDFDETYEEFNLSLNYDWLTLSVNGGSYDAKPSSQDYQFYSATLEHEGFYGTLGSFGGDFKGEYLELGYGFAVEGFDLGFAVIQSNADLLGGNSETNLTFSVSRSFTVSD